MSCIDFTVPSYPYFILAGSARYRPGDLHVSRRGIECFDMIAVESGTLYMSVGEETFAVAPNDILIIPPMTAHRGYKICREETFFHWLHFMTREPFCLKSSSALRQSDIHSDEHILLPMFQTVSRGTFSQIRRCMEPLETLALNRYDKAMHTKAPMYSLIQRQRMLMEIFQSAALTEMSGSAAEIPQLILTYIQAHYNEKITLATLADIASCHPTHVIRSVKKQFDMTPMQLVTECRIRHACQLLLQTSLSVTEIAYAVGFSSPAYFGRQFKEICHMSPNTYRTVLKEPISPQS